MVRGGSGPAGWPALALVLGAALLLAWFASVTPGAAPADAPADRFAAGRAMADIASLAAVPHPIGSPQDARVREALTARLRGLGLSPEVQTRGGITAWGERSTRAWTVQNVVARVRGSDPAAPAVLVMSHYDSVARSPGAADDMASVATALELARLLRARPPLRDVVFAFTDGEEAGLLGAQALFADSALRTHLGFVINMDVRGGGGRATMFQTGREAGEAARLFAAHAVRPQSDSLAAFLYEKMPNDTDFSVALAHGLPGLNYAFIGRPALYHTPAAVPSAVEAGAVQSLGEQVWAVLQPLAYDVSLPKQAPDTTWFDLFGRLLVVYPPGFGWVPVALSALSLGACAGLRRRSGWSLRGAAEGAGLSLAATVGMAAVLWVYARWALGGYYAALAHPWRTEGVIAAAGLAAGGLAFAATPVGRPLARGWGAVLLGWVIAVMLQVLAPRTAFLAEWPVLLGAVALLLAGGGRGAVSGWAALACCALAAGFLLEFGHMVVLGIGLVQPEVCAALLPLMLAVLAPWLPRARRPAAGS